MADRPKEQHYTYYRAKGSTLEAIQRIWSKEENAPKRAAKDVLQDLKTLGIADPQSVQIHKSDKTHPRPYLVTPEIFELPMPSGEEEYIVRVPVDYKGDHVAPEGAELLSDTDASYVEKALSSGGGWADIYSLNTLTRLVSRFGTTLPDDYDPDKSQSIVYRTAPEGDDKTRHYRVPLAMTGRLRKFFDDVKQKKDMSKDHLFKFLVTDDRKTLPDFCEHEGGMYLVYKNVEQGTWLNIDKHPDMGQLKELQEQERRFKKMFGQDYEGDFVSTLENTVHVDVAEYCWIVSDEFDRQIGIRPPLDPPKEMEELYCESVFRAEGKSKTAMNILLQLEEQKAADHKAFEEELFGKPELKDSFNVAGHSFSTYKSQFHPVWEDEGRTIIGLRCEWEPLHPHYTGMENVEPPEDWYEVDTHPGVYRPDPKKQPKHAEMLEKLAYPDYRKYEDVFGDAPMVRVEKVKDSYPRAYQEWPHVHALQDRFYIDVPKDYQDNVFRPTDSARLTKYEFQTFRGSCGDMYEPHFMMYHQGTDLPDDYTYIAPRDRLADTRYFLLDGYAEKAYNAFVNEKENQQQIRSDFTKEVGGNGGYTSTLGSGEMSSVSFEENVPPNWVEDGSHRTSKTDDDGNITEITVYDCIPDTKTEVGRELKRRMQSFDPMPTYEDLRDLLGAPEEVKVQIASYEGDDVMLKFDTSKAPYKFTPPEGSIEVPTSLIEWQQRDAQDERSQIKKPTMPKDLRDDFDKLQTAMKEAKALRQTRKSKRKKKNGPKR